MYMYRTCGSILHVFVFQLFTETPSLQEGVESPILRGEPLMMAANEELGRTTRRTSSMPNLFNTGRLLEPIHRVPLRHK